MLLSIKRVKLKKDEYKWALSKFIPEECCEWAVNFITHHSVYLKISKPRTTKMGDYRPPSGGKGHRISINMDLNKYSFFVTLVHEFAHLVVWNDFGRKVSPHGKEWKKVFEKLLTPFVNDGVFPQDVAIALKHYLNKPTASSCTDPKLMIALDAHNKDSESVFLDDIPLGSIFKMPNGMVFKKGKKLRKYYKCVLIKNNKEYRVSGLAKVVQIEGV